MNESSVEDHGVEFLPADERLYALHPESCTVHVKRTSEKEYCYSKIPGEEHFHLLMLGEIFVEMSGEKFCLNCAFRRGDLTKNRLHWKRSE